MRCGEWKSHNDKSNYYYLHLLFRGSCAVIRSYKTENSRCRPLLACPASYRRWCVFTKIRNAYTELYSTRSPWIDFGSVHNRVLYILARVCYVSTGFRLVIAFSGLLTLLTLNSLTHLHTVLRDTVSGRIQQKTMLPEVLLLFCDVIAVTEICLLCHRLATGEKHSMHISFHLSLIHA